MPIVRGVVHGVKRNATNGRFGSHNRQPQALD
jgi:hypothetical protein